MVEMAYYNFLLLSNEAIDSSNSNFKAFYLQSRRGRGGNNSSLCLTRDIHVTPSTRLAMVRLG